jgi:SAM-dependent methyltransferase
MNITESSPRHSRGAYDNPFAFDNVYGHALELLARHRLQRHEALHIDIGCGYGRIAEPLKERLGLTYIACDLDEDALCSLDARGFETHRLILGDEEAVYQALSQIIDKRPLASISILDTLEHLDDPAATLRALRRIAAEHQSFVLVSVPNIAHRDVGLRLLFGQWDYTQTGILDHTHRTLFSDPVLRRMLGHCGLHGIDANDVAITVSDQAFPVTHPVFQSGTHLHRLLSELRGLGDGFGRTNQFVRLCTAGPVAAVPPYIEHETLQRPLVSIVLRSEGRFPDALAELTTCLAGQTVSDFEVIIIGYKLDRPRQVVIEQVIEELPAWLHMKIRFLRIDSGNYSHLLNIGFAAATGRYISILEEGDVLFAHWVETFLHAANAAPGQILRSAAIAQQTRRVEFNFATGLRIEAGHRRYPLGFDAVANMEADISPVATLAFPRGLFHQMNLAFDESLPLAAGWDYLLRAAGLVGVTSVGVITAIVRDLPNPERDDEAMRTKILEKLDQSAALIWPAGTTKYLRTLKADIAYLQDRLAETQNAKAGLATELSRVAADAAELTQSNKGLTADLDQISREAEMLSRSNVDLAAELACVSDDARARSAAILRAVREVLDIYGSSSWRLAAPLRLVARLFGRHPMPVDAIWSLSLPQLQELAAALRRSSSWRVTAPLRFRFGRSR